MKGGRGVPNLTRIAQEIKMIEVIESTNITKRVKQDQD